MITDDLHSAVEDLKHELESLVSLLEAMDFGKRMKSWHRKPDNSAIRPGYHAKTYDEKNVSVEEDRIISLSLFKFEIDLSQKFDPKKHFMQFQQYSKGLWKDYALILMTDRKIGLLDLSTFELLKTIETTFPVKELYVQRAEESLLEIPVFLEKGRDVLEHLSTGKDYPLAELKRIVEILGTIHLSILFRTGMTGFFSSTIAHSCFTGTSDVKLGTFDLSSVKDGDFTASVSAKPIYLNPELSLKQSVSMDLSSSKGFTVIEKVCHQF